MKLALTFALISGVAAFAPTAQVSPIVLYFSFYKLSFRVAMAMAVMVDCYLPIRIRFGLL